MAAHSQLIKTKLNRPSDKPKPSLTIPQQQKAERRASSETLTAFAGNNPKKPRNCITGYNSYLNLYLHAFFYFFFISFS